MIAQVSAQISGSGLCRKKNVGWSARDEFCRDVVVGRMRRVAELKKQWHCAHATPTQAQSASIAARQEYLL